MTTTEYKYPHPSEDQIDKWFTDAHKLHPHPEKEPWAGRQVSDEQLDYVIREVVRFGSDQELDACCEWVDEHILSSARKASENLREYRRPPDLNELALQFLSTIEKDNIYLPEITGTIRKALTEKSQEDKK